MAEIVDEDNLAKYRRPGQTPAVATGTKKAAPGKVAYEPFRLSKDTKRHLEVRVQFPLPSNNPLNSMITNVFIEWRRGLSITVVYSKTMAIEIKGRNLQELAQAIKDWKVEWVEAFDAQWHLPVTDKNAPFIKSVEVITKHTEEPPPMHERH